MVKVSVMCSTPPAVVKIVNDKDVIMCGMGGICTNASVAITNILNVVLGMSHQYFVIY